MNLAEFAQHAHSRLDALFNQYIVESQAPAATLQQSIAYAALDGGKRARPLLVYLTGKAFDATWEQLDPAAGAIELIHVYSLIHDDLPAMDNADLRRGKPSCHKAFNEAIAILAGDALQPLAFQIIAEHPAALTPQQRLKMVQILSQTSGIQGMVAGQMLDIEGVRSIDELTRMYQLKTGGLLKASVQLGAIGANVLDSCALAALDVFAENIGLAFQIQDDLLDINGTSQAIGKPQGIDESNQKITYPALLGLEKCQQRIAELFDTAISALDFLGENNKMLCEFAKQLMQRKK